MNKRSQQVKHKKKLRQIARRKKKSRKPQIQTTVIVKQEEVFKSKTEIEENKFDINMFKAKPPQDKSNKDAIVNKGFDKSMWGMSNGKKT